MTIFGQCYNLLNNNRVCTHAGIVGKTFRTTSETELWVRLISEPIELNQTN